MRLKKTLNFEQQIERLKEQGDRKVAANIGLILAAVYGSFIMLKK